MTRKKQGPETSTPSQNDVARWELSETTGFILIGVRMPVLDTLVRSAGAWTTKDSANFIKLVSEAINKIRLLASTGAITIFGRSVDDLKAPLQKIDAKIFCHDSAILHEVRPKKDSARGLLIIDGEPRYRSIYIDIDSSARKKLRYAGANLKLDYPRLIKRLKRTHTRKILENKYEQAQNWLQIHGDISLSKTEERWALIAHPRPFPRSSVRLAHKELFGIRAGGKGGRPSKRT
jgi:hypothetical protein